MIPQITNPHVTKIRGAPCKKRIKGAMEISKGKTVMHEINNIVQIDDREVNSKSRKCLLCGIAGHYQKKCPSVVKK